MERQIRHTLLATNAHEGEPPAEQLLQSLIVGFGSLPAFLRDLGTLGAMLAQQFDVGAHTVDAQIEMLGRTARGLSNDEDLIERLKRGEYTAITDENQLANLALYSVAIWNSFDKSAIARRGSLLRTLALFNFVLLGDPQTGQYYIDPSSVQGTFSVAALYRERANNLAYRYKRFMEWGETATQGRKPIDVRASFAAAKGLSYDDYAVAVAFLDDFFRPATFAKAGIPTLPERAIHDPAVRTFVERHSWSGAEVKCFLARDPLRTLRDKGYRCIMERPLLLLDGEYHLLHPRGLENALGPAIFYAAMTGHAPQDFTALVGRFFQEYVGEILERLARRGGHLYSDEFRYKRRSTGQTVDSTDHFMLDAGRLLFLEDRFARLNAKTLEGLSVDDIEAAFQTLLFPKMEQLNKNITDYIAGDFDVPGIDRNAVQSLYPIVVLPHSFPRSSAVQERIDSEISNRNYLQGRHGAFNVMPYDIIEAEALEGLDSLAQRISIADLLDRKFANSNSRADFFKNHLIVRENLKLRLGDDEFVKRWFRDILERGRA